MDVEASARELLAQAPGSRELREPGIADINA